MPQEIDHPVLLAQVAYKHETLEDLLAENKLTLDYSEIKVFLSEATERECSRLLLWGCTEC